MLLTVKECFKLVLNYRSYPKNKSGYPFLDHPIRVNYRVVQKASHHQFIKKSY